MKKTAYRNSHTVELKDGALHIDGRAFYLYSAEIHYFRIPVSAWKDRIAKAKSAGFNTVSTYIPWIWHEPDENNTDFAGKTHPQRNLQYFIDCVQESGMYLAVRVGPVANAELTNEGIPEWLIRKYPQICASGQGLSDLPHVTLLSYNNTFFHDYVKKWYRDLLPLLVPRQADRGGPIILFQLENEIGMSHWVNGRADYSPEATQAFQSFLSERYGSIDKLKDRKSVV